MGLKIFTIAKTDFEKVWKEFFKEEPKVEALASEVLATAAPVILGIASVDDPALVPVLTPILTVVKAKMTAVQLLITQEGGAASIQSALSIAQSNLTAILSLAEVKSSTSAAKITENVNLAIGILSSVAALSTATSNAAAPVTAG